MPMQIEIQVGPYSSETLDKWIERVNDQMQFLTDRVLYLENTVNRFKEIVPLVDDELGMHESSTSIS